MRQCGKTPDARPGGPVCCLPAGHVAAHESASYTWQRSYMSGPILKLIEDQRQWDRAQANADNNYSVNLTEGTGK